MNTTQILDNAQRLYEFMQAVPSAQRHVVTEIASQLMRQEEYDSIASEQKSACANAANAVSCGAQMAGAKQ